MAAPEARPLPPAIPWGPSTPCTLLVVGLILLLGLSGTAFAMSGDEAVSPLPETPVEEGGVDEVLLEVLVADPSICCLIPRLELAGYPILAGPLYWRRLKILCPNIRPTAMC